MFEWCIQSPDYKSVDNMCHDLKLFKPLSFNLTELEILYREDIWVSNKSNAVRMLGFTAT